MEIQDKPLGMLIGRMMKETFKVLSKRIEAQTEAKLTKEQFWLLHLIEMEEKEVTQKDMATIMNKDQSAILRMIDCLEKKELVRRVVDLNDRRKNRIMLSKKGERAIEQFVKIEIELTKELIKGLSEKEWEIFNKVVTHVRENALMLQKED
jgi:MarR family transcriptional regulator, transcriptional regulator for hemolysin